MRKIFLAAFFGFITVVISVTAQTPTPTPTPLASPLPLASPTPIQKQVQTLSDLQSRIRSRLLSPELRRGHVGVKIVSMNTGKPASMGEGVIVGVLDALITDFAGKLGQA